MLNIEVVCNSFAFKFEDKTLVFPANSIYLIANDDSNIIVLKLKASRKTITTFLYTDVKNIQASSATEMVEKIGEIINK